MAKSNFYKKSNKGVQSDKRNSVRSNAKKIRSVNESENPAYSSKTSQTGTATLLTHEVIAERAWNIWQNRGCIPGEDEQNWYEAENQLKSEFDID